MANPMLILVTVVVIVAVGGLLAYQSFQMVDSGHRGVLTTWGAVDTATSYPEGGNFVIPFQQEIVNVSIQKQKYISDTQAASKDLQVVSTQITVNYHPDPSRVQVIYQELGVNYEDRIINPAVEETVKQVTANYNAEELITKRPLVKAEITDSISARLLADNIIVDAISITEFDFSDTFNAAIEAKVEAEQNALKAENVVAIVQAEALQRIAKAEGVAQSNIEEAEGKAEAIRLVAEAEAEAIRIKALAITENPQILTLEQINQWNGVFPSTYMTTGGDGVGILLEVPTNGARAQNP